MERTEKWSHCEIYHLLKPEKYSHKKQKQKDLEQRKSTTNSEIGSFLDSDTGASQSH